MLTLSRVSPPPVACPRGACGCDLLSYFPFHLHWPPLGSFPVSCTKVLFFRGKEGPLGLTQGKLGEKGPEQPFSVISIPPGSRLWNLLLAFTQILSLSMEKKFFLLQALARPTAWPASSLDST